ncbi:MAG: glycosyl hydrolase family 17 protein [Nanoarchaeota archaeon]
MKKLINKQKKTNKSNPFKLFLLTSLASASILFSFPYETKPSEIGHKPLKGICYSPFRDGQQPGGETPSEEEVRKDLDIVKSMSPKIRTYGTEDILFRIPEFCKDIEIDCYPGAWIDNASTDDEQISNLITIANKGYRTTKGLVVGNEFLYRNPDSKQKLIDYINQVKSSTTNLVTTAEQWHIWRDNPDLSDHVDFLTIHIHPYWENQNINDSKEFILEKYNLIKNNYSSGKKVVVGETGWPTEGETRGEAVPSEKNQENFLKDFKELSNQEDIDYFLFETFDENWKKLFTGLEVEAHWGIFYKDRTIKKGLQEIIKENTKITSFNEDGLNVTTYENNSYYLDDCTNLTNSSWQERLGFQGETNKNLTKIILENTDENQKFYRIRMEF